MTPVDAQQQSATYEVVSSFATADGTPNGVIQTRDGRFYGTTVAPPATTSPAPLGTVFVMDADGVRTTLHTFFFRAGNPFIDDGTPVGNLFEGADGSVYGTTHTSGDSLIPPGHIYKIGPGGVFTSLARQNAMPAGVIQASDGRLYGVVEGTVFDTHLRDYGGVFRVNADGTRTFLHQFEGADSANPIGELVEVSDRTLYGVTKGGGFQHPDGSVTPTPGAIFQIDPTTGALTIRHSFAVGIQPAGRLIQGTDGLVYGTTVNDGVYGLGTVFSFDPIAGVVTTLHHFSGAEGANPNAGVIQGRDLRLYGTTKNGGVLGYGTVFAVNVIGELVTLHDFASSDGANPVKELFQAGDGAFYGAAPAGGPDGSGVIFRIRLATSPPDGYVEIVSRNSGKCLDVYGASTDSATPVIQWTCHGGPNQQWRLEPVDGGAFRITARHSGQALDVFGASTDDLTPIIQWPPTGGDNQAWTLQPASDGYVLLVARHSGKAIDVELASTDDGARVIQYAPTGGANQQWLLRPVE